MMFLFKKVFSYVFSILALSAVAASFTPDAFAVSVARFDKINTASSGSLARFDRINF